MKRLIAMLCMVFILCGWTASAFAAERVESGVASESIESKKKPDGGGMSIEQATDPEYVLGIKGGNYSADHIGDKLRNKDMDVVYLLKIVGRYACLAAFVVCHPARLWDCR